MPAATTFPTPHPDLELGIAPPGPRADWIEAPMPGAMLCRIEEAGLREVSGTRSTALSADLRAILLGEARARSTRLALARSGESWRVRCIPDRAGAPLWLVQSVADSREAIVSLMRAALARRLAGSILHELRNPMNAISLYSDVLAMLQPKPPSPATQDKSATALKSLRDRLQDLNARVCASAELWIGEAGPITPVGLPALWREVHRLVNGYFTLNALRLEVEGADVLEASTAARVRHPFALVLIGMLMMSADAVAAPGREPAQRPVRLRFSRSADAALVLTVPDPLDASAFAQALGGSDDALAPPAFALILSEYSARVSAPAGEGISLALPAD